MQQRRNTSAALVAAAMCAAALSACHIDARDTENLRILGPTARDSGVTAGPDAEAQPTDSGALADAGQPADTGAADTGTIYPDATVNPDAQPTMDSGVADVGTSTVGEVCNGLDDNGNGQTDEGATCPAGQVCAAGACRTVVPQQGTVNVQYTCDLKAGVTIDVDTARFWSTFVGPSNFNGTPSVFTGGTTGRQLAMWVSGVTCDASVVVERANVCKRSNGNCFTSGDWILRRDVRPDGTLGLVHDCAAYRFTVYTRTATMTVNATIGPNTPGNSFDYLLPPFTGCR